MVEEYAKHETSMKQVEPLLGLLFDPEDGGDILLRNVCQFSTGITALHSGT
jgi:hypothetical protein